MVYKRERKPREQGEEPREQGEEPREQERGRRVSCLVLRVVGVVRGVPVPGAPVPVVVFLPFGVCQSVACHIRISFVLSVLSVLFLPKMDVLFLVKGSP